MYILFSTFFLKSCNPLFSVHLSLSAALLFSVLHASSLPIHTPHSEFYFLSRILFFFKSRTKNSHPYLWQNRMVKPERGRWGAHVVLATLEANDSNRTTFDKFLNCLVKERMSTYFTQKTLMSTIFLFKGILKAK